MGLEEYVQHDTIFTQPEKEDVKSLTACRACGGLKLNYSGSLGDQYVVDFPMPDDPPGLKAPLDLCVCLDCGLVQLNHTVNPERLFRKFWYRSGLNEQMRCALFDVVNTANSTIGGLHNGDAVLDIGANDGTLLSAYPRLVHGVGFEPADDLVELAKDKGGVDVIFNTFFQNGPRVQELLIKWHLTGFKVITALAMFYDVDNPRKFLTDVKDLLHPEGLFIIQMNSLLGMIQNNAFDNICHEHLCYYSFETLEKLLTGVGLEVVDVKTNDVNGGSMRVYITHADSQASWKYSQDMQAAVGRVDEMRKLEHQQAVNTPQVLEMFFRQQKVISRKLSQFIMDVSAAGSKVYVCGASTRGTTLLQTLDPDVYPLLLGASERDEKKHGRVMVGTRTSIVAEEEARKKANYLLVLPWHFEESIRRREQKWLESGGELIFPLPTSRVVSANGVTPL